MGSCIETTHITAEHADAPYDICTCASLIFFKIIKNHHLVDGNKRSAVICTYLFFFINGMSLEVSVDGLYDLAILVAKDDRHQDEVIESVSEVLRPFCMLQKR